uniref:hypothetical protein n=1 Tax=Prevotella sp. TaxID=59823 RepID=UPI004026B1F1
MATVVPVCTEQQAADFFSEIKKTYRDARHNVTAFLLKNGNLFLSFPRFELPL